MRGALGREWLNIASNKVVLMKPTNHLQRAFLAVVSATIVAIVAWVAGSNWFHSGSDAAEPKAAPVCNAYFGNLHVHSSWSNDAYNMGVRQTPDDAYRFSKGEAIRILTGELVKLNKPLVVGHYCSEG